MSYALLWSKRFHDTHVETLEAAMSSGRQAYTEDRATDWVLLAVGDLDDMLAAARNIAPTLRVRQEARDALRRAAA